MTENSRGMRKQREYTRLICAIVEEQPQEIINLLAHEYTDAGDSLKSFDKKFKETLEHARQDAKKYYSHRQGGRAVIVLKDSPLGRKLSRGVFAPGRREN